MKALSVDDSRLVRRMVCRTLAGMGFEVAEAADGQEALGMLLDLGPPDLIVLDWNMPVVDGLEFLIRMRKLDRFVDVKVIMLTARNELGAVQQAVMAGANEYLMKPFTPHVLEEKVRNVCGLMDPETTGEIPLPDDGRE